MKLGVKIFKYCLRGHGDWLGNVVIGTCSDCVRKFNESLWNESWTLVE